MSSSLWLDFHTFVGCRLEETTRATMIDDSAGQLRHSQAVMD